MSVRKVFKMPKPAGISGRTSTITNSFVNSIIPAIIPTEKEIEESLKILCLDKKDLKCAYCGDRSTEWDHLRQLLLTRGQQGIFLRFAILSLGPYPIDCTRQAKFYDPTFEYLRDIGFDVL